MEQNSFLKNMLRHELESRYSFVPKEYIADAVGEAYSEYFRFAPEEVCNSLQKTTKWLRTVAIRRLSRLYPHPSISIDKNDTIDIPDDRENVETDVANKQTVEVALNFLSLILRETIVLHFLQGMTHEEISSHLNVSLETIKKRAQRGMEIMRERMTRKNI